MTGAEAGGGVSTPPPVGPDGQTMMVDCITCEGAGMVQENHGGGAIETLGCPDCCHPDNEGCPDGKVWRYYLLHPDASGSWLLRGIEGGAVVELDSYPTRATARWWLREKEHGVALVAVSRAELDVVALARRWKADREAGVLGADEPLRDAVVDLERACEAHALVEAARLSR